jgi:hypothetical protein
MLGRKSLSCSYLVVALLSITAVVAQSSQPRREPDVPYVPTTEAAVQAMLKLAGAKKSDIVYTSAAVMAVLSLLPPRASGRVESESILTQCASTKRKRTPEGPGLRTWCDSKRTTFSKPTFREASVVTLFLLPDLNLKLRPKLLQELKPGTRIVSNSSTWAIGSRKRNPPSAAQTRMTNR